MFASRKIMKLWACRLSYLSTRPITQFFGNKMLKNGRGASATDTYAQEKDLR